MEKIKRYLAPAADWMKANMKYLKQVGKIVSILAIAFVAYTVYSMIGRLDEAFFSWSLAVPVAVSVVVYCGCNAVYAYSYRNILQNLTDTVFPMKEIAAMYLTANIYKYLPSNVMHYVGRNLLAQQYQISQKKVALSTVYEIVNVILVTLAYCLACWLGSVHLLLLIPFYGILALIAHRFKMTRSFLLISLTTLINNMIVVYFYNMYTATVPGSDFARISIYQSVSWLVGFLTPGAPGGLGVKEMVLIKLGTADLAEVLTVVAVMQRIILILGDFLAFVLVKLMTKLQGVREHE